MGAWASGHFLTTSLSWDPTFQGLRFDVEMRLCLFLFPICHRRVPICHCPAMSRQNRHSTTWTGRILLELTPIQAMARSIPFERMDTKLFTKGLLGIIASYQFPGACMKACLASLQPPFIYPITVEQGIELQPVLFLLSVKIFFTSHVFFVVAYALLLNPYMGLLA